MKYYYEDQLAAQWMVGKHEMQFVDEHGAEVWLIDGVMFSDNGIVDRAFVDSDSLCLLEPQIGDLIRGHNNKAAMYFMGDTKPSDGVHIVQRGGIPFMWPDELPHDLPLAWITREVTLEEAKDAFSSSDAQLDEKPRGSCKFCGRFCGHDATGAEMPDTVLGLSILEIARLQTWFKEKSGKSISDFWQEAFNVGLTSSLLISKHPADTKVLMADEKENVWRDDNGGVWEPIRAQIQEEYHAD